MGCYIGPVSGQSLGKHVLAATVTHPTGETVCGLRGPRREFRQTVQLSSAREAEKIEPERVKLKNLHC
jgi:hypothetical protein